MVFVLYFLLLHNGFKMTGRVVSNPILIVIGFEIGNWVKNFGLYALLNSRLHLVWGLITFV